MHVSLFSWQNQLLAKGLLFMEEKVKLCEGKHSRKPILEGSCALMFGQTGWFACLESIQPFLVLSWGVAQPFRSPCESGERAVCLKSHSSHGAPTCLNCITRAGTWVLCGSWAWAHITAVLAWAWILLQTCLELPSAFHFSVWFAARCKHNFGFSVMLLRAELSSFV